MEEIDLTFRIPLMLEYSRIFTKTIVHVTPYRILQASDFITIPVEGGTIFSVFETIHVAMLRKYFIENEYT